MNDRNIQEFTCDNCGSRRYKIKYKFKNCTTQIIECNACGLMKINPLPSHEELENVYNEFYFKNEKLIEADVHNVYGYFDYIEERINKQKGYNKVCKKIRKYLIPSSCPPKLVDYGCGLGFFLDSAYDYGFSVKGIEFNRSAMDYIKRRYSYQIETDEEFKNSNEKFDVVTLFDVIEHLREPFEFMEMVQKKINDNGLLVISTVDSKSIISRFLGEKLEDFRRIKEHLYFFSRKNLISNLIKYDFEILEVLSQGHSFQLHTLFSRIKSIFPIIGSILYYILKIFPFIGNINIYFNPFTKFIVYARKKCSYEKENLPQKKISIIIPVYNEDLFIEEIIKKILNIDLKIKKEIIIVNDGSTDKTVEIIEKFQKEEDTIIINKIHEGKGSAVAKGIALSKGDFVIIQDADLEYDPLDMHLLLDTMFKTKANVVYGTRFKGQFRRTGYFILTVGNNILTFLTNIINNLNLSDMETGYKLFNGNFIRTIKLSSKSFDFEPEITCKISRFKVPIFEVPISYNARTFYEGKKIKFKDGIQACMALIKYGILNFD